MSGDGWVNVRVSGVALEVPVAKDLLESEKYWLSRFCKGCAVDFDIPMTMTGRTRMKKKGWKWI